MGNTGGLTALFLQVRLDSTRLPRKALLPLGNKLVVESVMESLKKIPADHKVLFKEPERAKDLYVYNDKRDLYKFLGSKDNVLKRFADGVRKYNPHVVIRATGDNPLVSWELAAASLDLHIRNRADLTAYQGNPLGTGVEIINAGALLESDFRAEDQYEREHVTPYIYRHPERFLLLLPPAPEKFLMSEGRVTLDTEEDYMFLKALYKRYNITGPVPLELLISYLSERKS